MEYRPYQQIRDVADVHDTKLRSLSRRERLERWAEVLERQPDRRLHTLYEMEFTPKHRRADLRADNSPLTVAFEDPVLRAEGLTSDRLGDAMLFFELSERAAHRLLCSCMHGRIMHASTAGQIVRRLATPNQGLWHASYALGGALVAAPALVYLFS